MQNRAEAMELVIKWWTNQVHDELALVANEPSLAQGSANYSNFGQGTTLVPEPQTLLVGGRAFSENAPNRSRGSVAKGLTIRMGRLACIHIDNKNSQHCKTDLTIGKAWIVSTKIGRCLLAPSHDIQS
jgi:hypothetical protein